MSKKIKPDDRFREQLEEFQRRIESLLRPAQLIDEIWRQGPKVRLEGSALSGRRAFAEAMFKLGYRHAAEHFLRALHGDSAALEKALLGTEEICIDDDPMLETVRGEDVPQC